MKSIWMLCQHLTHAYQSKRENVLYWLEIGSCWEVIDSVSFIDIMLSPEETKAQLRKQRIYVMGWSLSLHSSTDSIDRVKILTICESKDYTSSSPFKKLKISSNKRLMQTHGTENIRMQQLYIKQIEL